MKRSSDSLYAWDNASHDNVIAFGTILIAVFTFVLYRSTDKLWEAGEKQLRHLEDTAQRQLRAYVIVQGTRFESEPGKFASHFLVENAGQTPAHNVRIISNTCVLLHPVGRDFDFSFQEQPDPSSGFLGANKSVTSESWFGRDEVRIEEFDEAVADNGWLRIYTYGTVTYEDVFNNPQWTHFCYYFQWTGKKVSATASEHHNDAS